MAIGKFSAYSMVIVSGTNLTAETDLGRGFSKVIFDIAGAKLSRLELRAQAL